MVQLVNAYQGVRRPMLKAQLIIRNDPAGQGHYGASRGSREHQGIDYHGTPGTHILSPVTGIVTKLGTTYADDPKWRYVQVTDNQDRDHRFFYVEPSVKEGQAVGVGDPIGVLQDITQRYPDQGMLPHCHYEVKVGPRAYLNPESLT